MGQSIVLAFLNDYNLIIHEHLIGIIKSVLLHRHYLLVCYQILADR